MGTSEKEVKIRRMTEADLQKAKKIDRLLVGEGRALSWSLRAETEWVVYRPALSFVAEQEDEMVDFLPGDIRGTDISEWIDMMGVAPAHQRRGIGRRLVDAFCEERRRNGVKPNVVIREDDEQLVRFWTICRLP